MSHPAEHESTGPTRRTVLAAVGLAGVGAATMAGCGADEAASDALNSATSSAKDAAGKAIDKASIPVGGGTILEDQKIVITQPTAGDFKAFSAVCPHQGCLLSGVANGTISCDSPCGHGSTYDAATGENTGGPATRGLTPKKVTIGADGVTVT